MSRRSDVTRSRTPTNPSLYVESWGPPDGEPLLFLTGFALSGAVFEPVVDLYVDAGFRIVLHDPRGAGRTGGDGALTSLARLAHDATRVLDHLDVRAAHVYGVSFGGMVAQEVALRFPDRVRGLVLGGTTFGGMHAERPSARRLARLGAAMARAAAGEGHRVLAPALFSSSFRRRHPDRVRELYRGFRAHRPTLGGLNAHWWASVAHSTRDRLPRLQAPTLILHGGADRLVPVRNAHLLARRIPDAEVVVIEGVGHAYLLEAPERSLDALRGWLDARGDIPAGRPLRGRRRLEEQLSRPFGLQVGAWRGMQSVAEAAVDRLLRS